ncbi:MAG: hypothetical protein A2X64_07420 [Ignavibacteria bacterium GWF2_33_9]|nr:MAG: hypothetical protein A2X64_07420 [Ignavibacteria bacterium GWF2_33_9]
MKQQTHKWRHALWLAIFLFLFLGSNHECKSQWWKDTVWTKKTDQVLGFYMLKFSKNDSVIVGHGMEKDMFYDAATGHEIKRISGNNEVFFLNNDLNFIRLREDNSKFEIFDAKSYKVIDSLESDSISSIQYSNCSISKNHEYIASIIKNGFRIWNIQSKKIEWTKEFPPETNMTELRCRVVSFNCDNSKIYVRLWRKYHDPSTPDKPEYYTTKQQTLIYDFKTKDSINIITNDYIFLSNTCKYMIIGVSGTNGIEIHDTESGELLFTLPLNILTVSGLEFSPDDKYLVTSPTITIWDIEKREKVYQYSSGTSNCIALSHDGQYIINSIGGYLAKWYARWGGDNVIPEPDNNKILYPNPTTGEINLSFILKDSGQIVINITDITGKMLKTVYDNFLNSGEQNIPLNVSWLTPGSYFLTIRNQSTLLTFKLIVNR